MASSGKTAGSKKAFLLIGTAFLICVLSTLIAFTQNPYPDPFKPIQVLSKDWWLYPREANAFKRLPVIGSDLNDIHVSDDGRKIWVVGRKGMIAHSKDGGLTWKKQDLPSEGEAAGTGPQSPQASLPRKGAGLESFEFVSKAYAAEKVPPPTLKKGEKVSKETSAQRVAEPPEQKNAPFSKTRNESIQKKVETKQDATPPQPKEKTKRPGPEESQAKETQVEKVQPPKPNPNLQAIHCIDDSTCWAVGEDGIILATTDGGQSWTPQTSGTVAPLWAVSFVSPTQGWCLDRCQG